MRILSKHNDISFREYKTRGVLVLNHENLTVFFQTQKVAIEHFLEVRPTQVILIALRLPICEQWGVKHYKTGMGQAPFMAKFHQADFDGGMSDGPKALTRTASVLASNLYVPFTLIEEDTRGRTAGATGTRPRVAAAAGNGGRLGGQPMPPVTAATLPMRTAWPIGSKWPLWKLPSRPVYAQQAYPECKISVGPRERRH
jgi:hypothetical protein